MIESVYTLKSGVFTYARTDCSMVSCAAAVYRLAQAKAQQNFKRAGEGSTRRQNTAA